MDAEHLKKVLIESAINVVYEKGLVGATTRAICEKACCNEVYIYRLFGGKEGLFKSAFTLLDKEIANYSLTRLEIDQLGLDNVDRRMLETIIKFYNGGPVGLETLAATVGEEAITLEDMYEPYLMQIGFLSRTPRGRCVTHLAYSHLSMQLPTEQMKLFGEES